MYELEIAYNDNFIMIKGSKNHLVIDRKGRANVVEGMPSHDCCKSGIKFMKLRCYSSAELIRIKDFVVYIKYTDEEFAFIRVGKNIYAEENTIIGTYELYNRTFY